jgi:CHAT domain-containing protein/tetratricopeptide (TPR) repeat protein
MNDESNPGHQHDLSEEALAEALENLIEGRPSLEGISGEASEEEAAELAGLSSASAAWQQKLAARLAETPRRAKSSAPQRTQQFYLWGGAAMAASLLVAVGVAGWWTIHNTPERLMAEAYSQTRIFELRMPGADYADVTPQQHLRGSDTGRESSRLLDARARIERHLESSPDDPHWLQLEARADVLEEKYDPAIDILDRLIAAGPVTSSLLEDDAVAYFQRGEATGSENDRATALDYLRRADELTPDDTLVLFNEAVVLEDRGQYINAVETWNRYIQFERDPRWLADGRRRLQALEQKLEQMKSHQGRVEQHLNSPTAMRVLAGDPVALAALDEELSTTLLPRLLEAAYPMPVDRSRGSPGADACVDPCKAARTLLQSLAASLQRNHHDSWLTQLLPAETSSPDPKFIQAARLLGQSIHADSQGDFNTALKSSEQAVALFHAVGNEAGEDRAELEVSYTQMRNSNMTECYRVGHPVLGRDARFAWIQIYALMQNTLCDPAPGTAGEDNPSFLRAIDLAHESGYAMLEMRGRNLLGAAAVDRGDTEVAWQIYLPTIERFYSGDYPPQRAYASLSALAEVEETTPRVQEALLLQREVVHVLEMTQNLQVIPTERFNLAAAAIRAGAIPEAEAQMRLAQSELAAVGGGSSVHALLEENEIAMAEIYLSRRDLTAAGRMLDEANKQMEGENNSYHRKDYAVARGQLALAEGHAGVAEPLLRDAILEEERLAGKSGPDGIVLAQQDRDLYAVLAGVWLAQGRPADQVLALWERYRLRILGVPAPVCANQALDCLEPKLAAALAGFGSDRLVGQIVLLDRLLLYRATAQGVAWTEEPVSKEEVLAAATPLERAVSSPLTGVNEVHRAARRAGELLLDPLALATAGSASQLLIESDPLLGNLPWPSMETAAGAIGLQFNLEELPSVALDRRLEGSVSRQRLAGRPLIVGASTANSDGPLLPEALDEAKAVAQFAGDSNLLLADQATETRVAARLSTATAIHFAGHAEDRGGEARLLLAPADSGSRATDQSEPYLDSALLRKYPPRAARLTVFSACSTGKKEEGWNHGMVDIVDTLASLGVPDVVATRWQIDSASAVPMMDAFYAGLAKGLTVPQALTAARQSLIRDPRYRHPYYWAAWYASGWGRENLSQVFQASR